MYVVYGLENPCNGDIFYVGVTCDVYQRFLQHLKCEGENEEKNEYIHSLLAEGYMPIMRTFERLHNKHTAYERERYWTQHYMHLKMPLTNGIVSLKKSLVSPVVPPVMNSSVRQLVRECLSEGCSQNEIIRQVWGVTCPGRASQKATEEFRTVLASLMPEGDIPDEKLSLVREMVKEHKSQSEIIAEVFPGMRNTDATQAYRKYLAAIAEGRS